MNRQQRRAHGRSGDRGRGSGGPATPGAGWFGAALAAQRAGRLAEAERLCRLALSVDPGHAQTLHLLGLVAHRQGRAGEAVEHIRMAIARDGRDPAFHHNLGNIFKALDPAAALKCYERALVLDPRSVDTLYNLGNTCQELGRLERAVACFERALRLRPDSVELHNNLGSALQDLGRLDEAVACYRRALGLLPDAVEALDNLAGALRAQGRLDAAEAEYRRALALRPNRIESHLGLGVVARDRGLPEEALARYRRALALAPDHPALHINIGVALVELGRPEEATAHYRRALAAQPDQAETHNNLGIALEHQGRYGEALACYAHALSLKPDYAQAHFNRAHALLLTGGFAEGWQEYEWRFAVARYDRNFDRPLWSGEPLAGRTILVHAEQGYGDTLHFVRYVPAVAERGGRVVIEAPRELVRLLGTVAGAAEIVEVGERLPQFDCHCPLLSLPRVFATNLSTIPGEVPYLRVPAEASAGWAERIPAAPGLRVGIVWAGTTQRATDIRLLRPLFEIAGVNWFSLQVGNRAADMALLDGVDIVDLAPWLDDFAETAAAICRLDLVLSVDTAVAHLAAALGRPTWLMLPLHPDWRWLLEREDSPWYPTARLFRQKKANDGPDAICEIAAALAQMVR
jgi:tetratricopeptide (TPR) repeat protein